MLRITEQVENEHIVRVRLDGTISAESLGELESIFLAHPSSDGHGIILDMAGVNFMHETAAQRLAKLRSESLQIINCSPFIAALLESAKSLD